MKQLVVFSSTHESYNYLKGKFESPKKGCIRFGSINPYDCAFTINPIEAIQTCVDKKLTKEAFDKAGVPTADWRWSENKKELLTLVAELEFPIVAKRRNSSNSLGVYKLDTFNDFETFIEEHTISAYIFEEFLPYSKEVRLYMSKDFGYIMGIRKMRVKSKNDGDWKPNDNNSIWVHEFMLNDYSKENSAFDKPDNWAKIIDDCQKATNTIEMDLCCFDLKLQQNENDEGRHRKNPKYIFLEANSAPWSSNYLKERYLELIPKIIKLKLDGVK